MNATLVKISFVQWAEDFMVRFAKFSEMIDQSDILRREFFETFKPFSLEVLQKATREMTLLDPAPFPNQVMGMLFTRCRSMTMLPRMHEKVIDPWEEPRYKCLTCRDGGAIQVYHPKAYAPIRVGTFEIRKHLNSIMVACTCDEGDKQASERRFKSSTGETLVRGLMRFESHKMKVVAAVGCNEQVDELTEFVLGMKPKFSGFEDYQ